MNSKLKCLVVDDEPLGREIIENYVNNTPFLELVGSFGKPFEALSFLQKNAVDVLLTDIEMPQINGLQMINSLETKPIIILISAYREYAIDGFDSGVIDYLVKPVPYDRFLKSLVRVQNIINKKIPLTEIKNDEIDRIFIKANNKLVKILFEDIVYVESLKDYLRIHISDTERYVTHSTMKNIEEKLPSYFFRIQRSYIINTKKIKSIHGNTVLLTIGENLPISLSLKSELYKKIGIDNQ